MNYLGPPLEQERLAQAEGKRAGAALEAADSGQTAAEEGERTPTA